MKTKDIYCILRFSKDCRAVAQPGRASESALRKAGGDAVGVYLGGGCYPACQAYRNRSVAGELRQARSSANSK